MCKSPLCQGHRKSNNKNAKITNKPIEGKTTCSTTLSEYDKALLETLSVERVFEDIQWLSTGVVNEPNGLGKGTASAGSEEEHKLARALKKKMKSLCLDEVKYEGFPVQTYKYKPLTFKVDGKSYDAVSLYGAGGTYGTRYGNKFTLSNCDDGKTVMGELVDGGTGTLQELLNVPGGVQGKVVVIRRLLWPVYEITEAARQGALALICYGYGYDGQTTDPKLIRQDAMYGHLQIPVISISQETYLGFKKQMDKGKTLTVQLKNKVEITDGTSYTVVGKIVGKKYPDEYILVSAHYDRWFVGAGDNCSGVAALIELARFVKNIQGGPDRTFLFLAFSAEEAGLYDSPFDWLAGSWHYVQRHPHILRNTAYALNMDIYGWTIDTSIQQVSPELIPFQQEVVNLAQSSLNVKVIEYDSPNLDSWNITKVGGGPVVYPQDGYFQSEDGPLSYPRYYHTDDDVFKPERFQAMGPQLKMSALGLLLADRSKFVPFDNNSFIRYMEDSIDRSSEQHPDIDYSSVRTALAQYADQATRVDELALSAKTKCQIKTINRGLMNVRKEIFPWIYAQSVYRLQMYNDAYTAVKAILEAAQQDDREATMNGILSLDAGQGFGWWTVQMYLLGGFSEATAEDERLNYYESGGWVSAYDHRPRLPGHEIDQVFYRLQRNETTPIQELEIIKKVADHIYILMTETIFVTAGKLRQGAELYRRYVNF